PENGPIERWITARLYVADADTRLAQYVLLGVGGMRALRAIGVEPAVVHLNEGHAARAPPSLAAPAHAHGPPLGTARTDAAARPVFTAHTPVPAGNDSYPAAQVEKAIGRLCAQLGVAASAVIVRGRTHPADPDEEFGVTQAALRMSRAANGVSRRHGEVARE